MDRQQTMKRKWRHSKLYLWWHWRKAPKSKYPLRYVGQDTRFIQYGLPLLPYVGGGGGQGGKRYLSPDGVIRVLGKSQVVKR